MRYSLKNSLKRCLVSALLVIFMLSVLPAEVYAATMTLSKEGSDFIKKKEGCKLTAYKNSSSEKYYTIGYGHYGPDVKKGMTITKAQADAYFAQDMKKYIDAINKIMNDNKLTLSQGQFDALVSIHFNTGNGWKRESEKVYHMVLKGAENFTEAQIRQNFADCCTDVSASVRKGLLKRRSEEADMFLKDMGVLKISQKGISIPSYIVNGDVISTGGTITSNYVITKVTAGLYAGEKAVAITEKKPDTTFCNVNDVAKQLKTSSVAPGTYDFRILAVSKNETKELYKNKLVVTSKALIEKEDVYRIQGKNRFETSYKTADELKKALGIAKFQTAVIATGNKYPDALSGSYLAYVKQAPILLSNDGKDGSTLLSYLKNNLTSGGKVYLLGGTSALAKSLEDTLKKNSYDVTRLSGESRYETNLAILKEAGSAGELLVCTGAGYADSLSASAAKKPVLLVGEGLTDIQKEYVSKMTGVQFSIIGGTSAVSETVETELASFGTVRRIKGANRYETSLQVAKTFVENPGQAVIAYGLNFPDGLCGGAYASYMNGPLLLTQNGQEKYALEYVSSNSLNKGAVLGGPGLISDKTVRNIFRLAADKIIYAK